MLPTILLHSVFRLVYCVMQLQVNIVNILPTAITYTQQNIEVTWFRAMANVQEHLTMKLKGLMLSSMCLYP